MNILILSTLLTSILFLFLGNFVFYQNPKSPLNRVFFYLCLFNGYNLFCEFMSRQAANISLSYMWLKIGGLWPFFIATLFHFTLIFTKKSKLIDNSLKNKLLLYLPALVLSIIDMSTGLITGTPLKHIWGYEFSIPGSTLVYTVTAVWAIGLSILAFLICIKYYLKTPDIKIKKQAKYVSISLIIPILIGIITEIFHLIGIHIPRYTFIATAGIPIFIGYAVWKHRLFTLTPSTAPEDIINTMPDFLILLGPDMNILRVNKALLDSFSYTEDELIGRSVDMLTETKVDTIEQLAKKSRVANYHLNCKTKSGHIIPVIFSISRLADDKGNTTGIIIIAKDISEQKKLELQLCHSERMAAIGTLSSGIAHEFNNLIAIIKGNTELNLDASTLKETMVSSKIILDASKRAEIIIKNMLTFSREDDEMSSRTLCNISVPVDSVLSLTTVDLEAHKIKITKNYKKTPDIMINKGEIQQVFLNLINNARDAMYPDGGTLKIDVKKAGKNVEISFSDTGKGIDRDDQLKVFEPFFTTKENTNNVDKVRGTGLGLSVSYGIVQRHGGSFEVESKEGKGSKFTVKLPC